MPKPRVITRCVASHYTGPEERIIEFSSGDSRLDAGGLISFRRVDGKLIVQLYRLDSAVEVTTNYDQRRADSA